MLAIRLLALWAAFLFVLIVCVSCSRVVIEPMEVVHRPLTTPSESVSNPPKPVSKPAEPGS